MENVNKKKKQTQFHTKETQEIKETTEDILREK